MKGSLLLFFVYFPAFLLALAFHESSHAWVANRFGDDTAKRLGRITLNPIPHMDFFGTFLLPVIFFFTPGLRFPIAGWGKPVPVDELKLKRPRQNGLWIALAGPVSNFSLALLAAVILRGMFWILSHDSVLNSISGISWGLSVIRFFVSFFEISVWINLGLGFFNLLPFHPLDGGKVVLGLLPYSWVRPFNRFANFGFVFIIALFYLGGFEIFRGYIQKTALFLLPSELF